MPELPEVEVTRRLIEPHLVGRPIVSVETTAPSYFFLTEPRVLKAELAGRTVTGLERHGKYLVAGLDDRRRLLLHLGMTGQLFVSGSASVRLLSATARAALGPEAQAVFKGDEHTHLRLGFADGGPDVLFRDVRKFGKVKLLGPDEAEPRLARLGIDALEARGRELQRASRGRQAAAKTLLLDQRVLAGVGNIYADEALFLARVRPSRPAGRLTRAECDRLAEALRRILARSIETGGTSIRDYITPDGADGGYGDERRVYGRAGEPCPVCAGPISRKVIGQRSTFYCAACQR